MKKDGGGIFLLGVLVLVIDSDFGGYDKFCVDFIVVGIG